MLCFEPVSRHRWALLGVALCAALQLRCSSREHPGPFEQSPGGISGSGDEGVGGFAISDAGLEAALCGNQQIPAISNPPNLYFVVDHSGSMEELLPGSAYSKYENARMAISDMLRAIGHRVRYGAALYPLLSNADNCAPGAQVFPTTAGDPPSYVANGQVGPHLTELLRRLGNLSPAGGTPTASSLRALQPTIVGLSGPRTYVVLMTDGAPNCNLGLKCGAEACIPNIEQASFGSAPCSDALNCCDPKNVGDLGLGSCVDADDTEAAVSAYQAAGVDTFVVGMPGTEAYRSLLGRLATAGNTARPGDTPYYAVSDTNQLTQALRAIGAQVAISCDLPLAEAPENPELVNVYFDDQVVPNRDLDGWHYTAADSIQFVGAACDKLTAGDVLNVQVLAGCPTVVR